MKLILSLFALLASGCEFYSGSSNYSKAFGKSYSQSCIQENILKLEDFTIARHETGVYELNRVGVAATIELKLNSDKVTGYTLKTKTEKSQDKYLHKQIENGIVNNC